MQNTIVVTGGAGFIGSAVARILAQRGKDHLVVLDAFTYAANRANLDPVRDTGRVEVVVGDIQDADVVGDIFRAHAPRGIIHLAAESHVDRSIDGPRAFLDTNVTGTFNLLERSRDYLEGLEAGDRDRFRFVHVSTDEVFGSLGAEGAFTPETPYDPSSPYSASKAASDHLVRAWHRTYGVPAVVTNCSNNYGPYQFPEKLIPHLILSAIAGEPLPIYGDGSNVRDWLYVDDHANALIEALDGGTPGATYLIGGAAERTNLEVAHALCRILDEVRPKARGSYADQIEFVTDRPGHDHRYAIDWSQTEAELGWRPTVAFEEGLRRTVAWHLEHESWWKRIRSGEYRGERLGVLT